MAQQSAKMKLDPAKIPKAEANTAFFLIDFSPRLCFVRAFFGFLLPQGLLEERHWCR
jgi:hypothetical protein